MRNCIPVVMSDVLGIYRLIVAVIIQGSDENPLQGSILTKYSLCTRFAHLGVGSYTVVCPTWWLVYQVVFWVILVSERLDNKNSTPLLG